jgi:hypothetical protein
VPKGWRKYAVPDSISVNGWLIDLAQRVAQLDNLTRSANFQSMQVWLGGLFFPEAFVTATRQAAARGNDWSAENLHLELQFLKDSSLAEGFTINGTSRCRVLRSSNLLRTHPRGRRMGERHSYSRQQTQHAPAPSPPHLGEQS